MMKPLFIEAAFHQNGFSSNQLFIEPSQKWLIYSMNESLLTGVNPIKS
jgi:hypothetical protein